jgi:galactarate dehydratase
MTPAIFSKDVPSDPPAIEVSPEDMARVTVDDWRVMAMLARGYCRSVDATRSRKRCDGSATIVRDGYGTYGTDDASDDVTQDAVLIFAHKLAKKINECTPASCSVATREVDSWQHICRDGRMIIATRENLRRWSVLAAAERNGFRRDIPPSDVDATPGAQVMAGLRHAEHLAYTTHLAQGSETLIRMAWGDGSDFPTLRELIKRGNAAAHLGRAGVWAHTAQALHGGAYGSRRKVIETREAARVELRELSARLDEARDTLVYRGAHGRVAAR